MNYLRADANQWLYSFTRKVIDIAMKIKEE